MESPPHALPSAGPPACLSSGIDRQCVTHGPIALVFFWRCALSRTRPRFSIARERREPSKRPRYTAHPAVPRERALSMSCTPRRATDSLDASSTHSTANTALSHARLALVRSVGSRRDRAAPLCPRTICRVPWSTGRCGGRTPTPRLRSSKASRVAGNAMPWDRPRCGHRSRRTHSLSSEAAPYLAAYIVGTPDSSLLRRRWQPASHFAHTHLHILHPSDPCLATRHRRQKKRRQRRQRQEKQCAGHHRTIAHLYHRAAVATHMQSLKSATLSRATSTAAGRRAEK